VKMAQILEMVKIHPKVYFEIQQNLKLGAFVVHVMMYFVTKIEIQTHYRLIHMKMKILAPKLFIFV
jgi:hypothetical protein